MNEDQTRIDFYSPQKYDGVFLDKYEISVYDITGEQVLFKSFQNNTNSFNITPDVLNQNPSCAPYVVIVKAVNAFGSSDTSITLNNTDGSNLCSCIRDNGK